MLEINEIIVFSEHLFLFPTNNKFTLSQYCDLVDILCGFDIILLVVGWSLDPGPTYRRADCPPFLFGRNRMRELSIFVDESGDFVVHTGPLIRKEEIYCNMQPNDRRAIFTKLFFFALKTHHNKRVPVGNV